MLRKLLYHRGVDDSPGTYITGYCQSAVCLTFSLLLYGVIRRYGRKDGIKRSSYAVVCMLAAMSAIALSGAFTHQYLQEADPYEAWQDNWFWLIFWRTGNSLSGVFCFFLLLLGFQLLYQEGHIHPSRRCKMMLLVANILLSSAICLHSLLAIARTHHPFNIKITIMLTCAVAVIEAICSTTTLIKTQCCKSKLTSNDGTNLAESRSLKSGSNRLTTSSIRWDLIIHCAASWVFLLSGVVQVLLARFGCANYENAEVYTCPLSKSFNHNAVIHILLATDAGIFFVAEFLSIRHRRTMTSCS